MNDVNINAWDTILPYPFFAYVNTIQPTKIDSNIVNRMYKLVVIIGCFVVRQMFINSNANRQIIANNPDISIIDGFCEITLASACIDINEYDRPVVKINWSVRIV